MTRFLPLFILMLFVSCKNVYEDDCKVIEFNVNEILTDVSDLVDSVRFVALQQPDDAYMMATKMVAKDGRLYSLDIDNRVFIHDMDGHLLNVLDRKGRGSGEYSFIQDLCVDDRNLYILDWMARKIFVYDKKSLQFSHEVRIPFVPYEFELLDDGGFLFTLPPRQGFNSEEEEKRYRVIVTDKDMNVREKYFSYAIDEYEALQMRNLFATDDEIYYSSYHEDGYCVFDKNNGELLDRVRLQFENPIPDDKRDDHTYLIERKHSCLVSVPVVCGYYMSFACFVDADADFYIYDGRTFHRGNKEDARNVISGVMCADEDVFIAYWPFVHTYEDMVSRGFERAAPDIEAQIYDDVPLAVLYRMK